MGMYIILSRFGPDAFEDPADFPSLAADVASKIKSECPEVHWRDSFATMGGVDVVDILESDDVKQVEKAAMLIRAYGHSTTETLVATPWDEFLAMLKDRSGSPKVGDSNCHAGHCGPDRSIHPS